MSDTQQPYKYLKKKLLISNLEINCRKLTFLKCFQDGGSVSQVHLVYILDFSVDVGFEEKLVGGHWSFPKLCI